MKKKNLFMALAAICAGFTFTSCSNDIDDVVSPGQLADPTRGVSMNITKVGTSEMTNVTRASATEVGAWATAPDKNIGVSVYSSADGTEAMKTGSVNMKWTFSADPEGWTTQTPLLMFPGDEGVVTAYYPYGESVNPTAIDIDGTKDYMYARIGDNKTVNYGSPQTSLLMHHANAQLRVNLIRKGYAGTGTISSFAVKGSKFASAGKLNSLTGVVSNFTMAPELTGINEGTLADDISTTPTAKIEALYTWFVPVSDAAAPVTFDATVDGLKLRYTTSQQFLAGKRYTFNLAVTSSLGGELMLTSVDIDPWTEENEEGDLELVPPAEKNPIDLGLPSGLKWAQANLGADKETDPGLYYMWGDTEGHEKDSGYEFTSANYTAKGLDAISTNLTLAQDAANVRLGGSWRMPTKAEFTELYDNTNVTWTTINGVNGRKFTNKNDASKYIFIPTAGFYFGSSLYYWGSEGCYRSSTFYSSSTALSHIFPSGYLGTDDGCRYYGYSVRGVLAQ